ncbi:exopolygalacturonase-like [Corylus avellana]|uniref:exopolygalacturonase-like n=1 Tax=Corylus avellana TaxID=13451 RepID=UPI001E217C8C|nr:exopolygalacturonase-like [Corylus avellana]
MSIAKGFVVKALVFVLLGITLLFLEAECARRGLGDLADIADGKTIRSAAAGKTLGSEDGNYGVGDYGGDYGNGNGGNGYGGGGNNDDGKGSGGNGGSGKGDDGKGSGGNSGSGKGNDGKGSGGNGGSGKGNDGKGSGGNGSSGNGDDGKGNGGNGNGGNFSGSGSGSGGSSTGYNVNSYGAKADGHTNSAQAFIKAWDAACKSGGAAKVVIPSGSYVSGQVVFAGPCQSSTITLEIQGTVKATTDLSDYPSPEWFSFESVDGLIITGSGTLDGQGPSVWKYNDCKASADCSLLPSTIALAKIKNADISGIHSVNSKSFHIIMSFSSNVKFHGLTITAPGDSPNTDGIHVSTSSQVDISGITVGTGDDCISVGHGTTQLTVSDVTCGPGHGISIGSLGKYKNEEDVSGVTVSHVTLKGTTNGVRIKTWEGSEPSKASDITFEDITMIDVANPIIIDQKYGSLSDSPSKVAISGVHYKGISGTTTTSLAVSLTCSTSVPCQSISMVDIDLKYSGGNGSVKSECTNADMTCSGKQIPSVCANYN